MPVPEPCLQEHTLVADEVTLPHPPAPASIPLHRFELYILYYSRAQKEPSTVALAQCPSSPFPRLPQFCLS